MSSAEGRGLECSPELNFALFQLLRSFGLSRVQGSGVQGLRVRGFRA